MNKKIAVLISGRGSNLQALIDACADANYPADIKLIISNNPDVQGLEKARKAGIKSVVVNHRDYSSKPEFEAAMHNELVAHGIELACLAGFMRILSAEFVNLWLGRMINIHPSLLPKYKGLDTHRRAIEAGDTVAGCTVHFVTPEMDSGEAILQTRVPIVADDTEETLAARVLAEEHKVYPAALRLVAEGNATL